jgi:hypothetical protein
MNIDNLTKDKSRQATIATATKKPYKPPKFRFESVFEVSALACGKTFASGSSCAHSRKAS